MNRKKRLLSLFETTGLGLEIGPSFNPLLPKREGYNVESLDHLNAEDLIDKYSDAPGVDISNIEPVDFVSTGSSVFLAIGIEHRYDYIVASHVIEHTVDFVGFLKDCERLLKTDGVLVLAVPDKRFSFDVLRSLASVGDVLQAHVDGRTRHSPGAIFDEVAYNCLRGGALAWKSANSDELKFFSTLQEAKAIFEATQNDSQFRDIHAWQFTPSSFRLLVSDLSEIGYIRLRESRFYDGGGEFFVVLSRNGSGAGVSRMSLAQQTISEQFAIKVCI